MLTQAPEIAVLGDWRTSFPVLIFRLRCIFVLKDQVDLSDLEAGQSDIQTDVERHQVLELDLEDCFVPADLLSKFVVGARM